MAPKRDLDDSALALFADELRAVRAKAGVSQDQLALKINYSASLIAMIESRQRVPRLDFAQRCDNALSTGGTLTRMHKHLRTAPFPAGFRPFVEHEATATSLRTSQDVLMPGLLQTRGYARSVLSTRPNTTADEIDELVTARLERQAVLNRDEPPLLWVLIDEGVLHREVGNAKVMHAQLVHLAEMALQPNITIQIVPFAAGAHSGLLGAFVIADFDDVPSIVYLETAAEGQTVEEPSVVAKVALTFDALRSEALTHRVSRDLIMKVAEERWT